MNETAKIDWLARRVALGASAVELDAMRRAGAAATAAALVDPAGHGIAPAGDPFAALARPTTEPRALVESVDQFLRLWLDHMATTPRPLEEAMTWFWHDHFAVQSSTVRSGRLMADHINLLRKHALGNFRTLIREVTVDAAMLVYLDGARSTAQAPNENYGRELLELYTMGIGNYTEADVRAASVALTGWQVRPALNDGRPTFNPRLHDARPQTLLGRTVSDVESVVNTAVEHPATATHIAGKLATWFLGPGVSPALVESFAAKFRAENYELAPLVAAVINAGLDGHAQPMVVSPALWWSALRRATGVAPEHRQVRRLLDAAGQLPGDPPNVGGWPSMSAWLGASATAARVSLATLAADAIAADHPALAAAAKGDLDALAAHVGLASGFAPSTRAAIGQIGNCGRRPGSAALALALASPELAVVGAR